MKYLVTTRKEIIPVNQDILMVDGTVPGWEPRENDLHYDHHKPGGADIQIQEIEPMLMLDGEWLVVTTQVDADACVAACWLQLTKDEKYINYPLLAAIAYDCDHLAVPSELSDLSDFASQAVAALKSQSGKVTKDLGLPDDRKAWSIEQKEAYASEAFKRGTEWLISACKNECLFPGENGEANSYWEQVEKNTQMIVDEARVRVYRDCLLFDGKGLQGKYIDPRCWLKAAKMLGLEISTAITLVQREVIIENEFQGYSYTLGCVPLHQNLKNLDYTKEVFKILTEKERKLNTKADGWGGRKTVGGSGWNTPSGLYPEEIIDAILE